MKPLISVSALLFLNCATVASPIPIVKAKPPAFACRYKDTFWSESNFTLKNSQGNPFARVIGFGRKVKELVVPFEEQVTRVKVTFETAHVQLKGMAELTNPLNSYVQNDTPINAVLTAEKGAALEWVSGTALTFSLRAPKQIVLPQGNLVHFRCEDTRIAPFHLPMKLPTEGEVLQAAWKFVSPALIDVSAAPDSPPLLQLQFKENAGWLPTVISQTPTHTEISVRMSNFFVHGFVKNEHVVARESEGTGGLMGGLGFGSGGLGESREQKCTQSLELFDAEPAGVFSVGVVQSGALMHIVSRSEKTLVVEFPELRNEMKLLPGHTFVIRAEDESKCFPPVVPANPAP